MTEKDIAKDLLKSYRVDGHPLYLVGMFDTGVTVFSQQVRALNLAWALLESDTLRGASRAKGTSKAKVPQKVAIIGAGFAGLTLAAALLKKQADIQISIFEQRDTLLPLQQGSDSRWLHPRIYDWPSVGSQAGVAMLPVLNWTAARASDVVVQVLANWKRIVNRTGQGSVSLYCNARHLQIHDTPSRKSKLSIEWVGERREPCDGTFGGGGYSTPAGMAEDFDIVVLTTGFGLEANGAVSYWRNENVGQPSLDEPRRTYLISGQGDGAMIDLLRVRISQYRQDRILDELFSGQDALLEEFRKLYEDYAHGADGEDLFSRLEKLSESSSDRIKDELEFACMQLRRRLRRDTDAILGLRVRKLAELFDSKVTRISFQNKVLVFLLYKCGGFVPSTLSEIELVKQYGISEGAVIRRHGTLRDQQVERLLSDRLNGAIKVRRGSASPDPFAQSTRQRWPGGYFDIEAKDVKAFPVTHPARSHWRKEYLPGPTEMLATAFCSALAGFLLSEYDGVYPGRLRVTLHRSIVFGDEELLQQTCDYQGTDDARAPQSGAGRTFPANNGTIGLAYESRKIVRSVNGVSWRRLHKAMGIVRLNDASSAMSRKVTFVLAVPLLESDLSSKYTGPSPVFGVIYIDSTVAGYHMDDECLARILAMTSSFIDTLKRIESTPPDRVHNISLSELKGRSKRSIDLPAELADALVMLRQKPPSVNERFQMNFDYADFVPVRFGSTP